jgi:hypothetical protein
MRDAEGGVVRWYALLTDINDRKSVEDPRFRLLPTEPTAHHRKTSAATRGCQDGRANARPKGTALIGETGHFCAAHAVPATARRSVNANVIPASSFAVAQTLPPCASTIVRAIDSPIPMPDSFDVASDARCYLVAIAFEECETAAAKRVEMPVLMLGSRDDVSPQAYWLRRQLRPIEAA